MPQPVSYNCLVLPAALVRPASPRLAEGEVSLERRPVDLPRARQQHGAYAALLRELGHPVRTVELDELELECGPTCLSVLVDAPAGRP